MPSSGSSPNPRRTAAIAGAASAVLGIAAGTGIWLAASMPASPPHRLSTAASGGRRVDGRLTGGFSYAPLSRTPAGGADAALLAVAGELQRAADADPTPANLQAYGAAQLLLGRHEAAVATLQNAALESDAAAIHADLGVARLALASTDRADELPRAAEALEQALAANANLAEAWFTKAIVLEKLRMPSQAREAWQTYLKLDPRSRWSEEARARLAALAAQQTTRWEDIEKALLSPSGEDDGLEEAALRYPADVRDAIVRSYLPAWAAALDPDVERHHRQRLQRLADKLEGQRQDRFFRTVLEEMARMPAATIGTFRSAVLELGEGLAAQAAERPNAEVRSRLERAAATLRRLGSTLALWAEFTVARLDAVTQQHASLMRRATGVVAEARRRGFAALEARARLQLGMTAFTLSRWSDAAEHYDEAIRLCEQTGEDALASNVHTNAAVLARFLGNRLATWRHREQAGRTLPLHRALQVHLYLTSGAATAAVEALPLTALLFQNEVVGNARTRLPPGPQTEAFIARARMLARVGRHDAAERDLNEASRLLNGIASEAMRRRFERAWLLGSAEVRGATDPATAAADAERAVGLITATSEPVRLAEASLLQSRALSRLGRRDAARAAVERGLTEFEAALGSVDPRDPSRLAALEPVWGLYAEATRLSLAPGREDLPAAFEMFERGRARTHLDLRKMQPLGLLEARQRLKDDEGILLLDQSADDLVTWWIERGAVTIGRARISQAELDQLVTAHRRSVEQNQRRAPSSARLFELAIHPHWPAMRKKRVAAVIGDGAWNHVAWPALWDAASGTEIVSVLSLISAPSATVALSRSGKQLERGTALIVSAAVADGSLPLPGARAEAREIAAVYARSVLLDSAAATPARVLELAPRADVLHVSSHANSVAPYPQLAHLLLAGPSGADRLFVGDITAVDLSSVRLVVLAACATAGRSAVRGEGSVGVAWAFLTAGAGSVIATLQDVDDDAARRFFPEVHRRIAAGRSPAEALHAVQREWAQGGQPPGMWANVAVLGSL
ncbi:MAG TPA: CHAT domain-containing protein [Vicinamibacterales bacterium]|nr:CHAT domain-containing protein [Vicinamibacterales bacterium]